MSIKGIDFLYKSLKVVLLLNYHSFDIMKLDFKDVSFLNKLIILGNL